MKPKKIKNYHVEKVVTLNSFDTKKEASDWMKKVKRLNDDSEVSFQISLKTKNH